MASISRQLTQLRQVKRKSPTSLAYEWTTFFRSSTTTSSTFGFLFDIDGVIVRGRKVLPSAVEAFRKLTNKKGEFKIPTVFVTNAGNMMRHQKAQQLSEWLGARVTEDQVVMSHSPLRLFRQFHDKHCLISGQGPIVEIAKGLGFNKVTTVDQLRNNFPTLDAVDHKRRTNLPCAFERYFPRIEAVVLFGEPVRWETSLQLIVDVLMTNGLPCDAPPTIPYPHLPLLACNMDLQWMAEACLPRFGHGAFLVCLENLYKKITGKDMIYTALVGKPSEITYHHSEYCVLEQASKLSDKSKPLQVQTLYAVGDNVNTDVYGANLYNRYVERRRKLRQRHQQEEEEEGESLAKLANSLNKTATTTTSTTVSRMGAIEDMEPQVTSCESILVCTGVYNDEANKQQQEDPEHAPRDFLPAEVGLKEPNYIVENVLGAVDLVLEREGFHSDSS